MKLLLNFLIKYPIPQGSELHSARAQIIELEISREDLKKHLAEVEYGEILLKIWDILHPVAPFAFRVLDDIKKYIDLVRQEDIQSDRKVQKYWQEALDEQIMQKILPKIKGINHKVEPTLNDFIDLAKANSLSLSEIKAQKMLDRYRDSGFTSYF